MPDQDASSPELPPLPVRVASWALYLAALALVAFAALSYAGLRPMFVDHLDAGWADVLPLGGVLLLAAAAAGLFRMARGVTRGKRASRLWTVIVAPLAVWFGFGASRLVLWQLQLVNGGPPADLSGLWWAADAASRVFFAAMLLAMILVLVPPSGRYFAGIPAGQPTAPAAGADQALTAAPAPIPAAAPPAPVYPVAPPAPLYPAAPPAPIPAAAPGGMRGTLITATVGCAMGIVAALLVWAAIGVPWDTNRSGQKFSLADLANQAGSSPYVQVLAPDIAGRLATAVALLVLAGLAALASGLLGMVAGLVTRARWPFVVGGIGLLVAAPLTIAAVGTAGSAFARARMSTTGIGPLVAVLGAVLLIFGGLLALAAGSTLKRRSQPVS